MTAADLAEALRMVAGQLHAAQVQRAPGDDRIIAGLIDAAHDGVRRVLAALPVQDAR